MTEFGTDESTGLPLVEYTAEPTLVPGCPFCGEPLEIEFLLGHYRFSIPNQNYGPCTEYPDGEATLVLKFTLPDDKYHTLIYNHENKFWMLSAWENYDVPKVQLTLVTSKIVTDLVLSVTESANEMIHCITSLSILKTFIDPAIHIPVKIKIEYDQ